MIALTLGMILGVLPGVMWGSVGGDEVFGQMYPHLRKFFRFIHHWEIGLID